MEFILLSNAPDNNEMFSGGTIPAMDDIDIHPSMRRLYKAAKELKGVKNKADVARLLNESQQTLNNWEKRGISKGGAIKAQELIGCSPNWLTEHKGPMVLSGVVDSKSTAQLVAAEPSGWPAPNVQPAQLRRRIPIISWVKAGNWADVSDPYGPGEADEWAEAYDSQPGDQSFALRVTGDSMTSQFPGGQSFPDGTVIIVDPSRATNAGDLVVAKDVQTQQATFKRLTYDGGRWFLKPINTAYQAIEIDDPGIRVIGRVIEYQIRGKL